MAKKPMRRPKGRERAKKALVSLSFELGKLCVDVLVFRAALRDLLAFYDRGGHDGAGWTAGEVLRIAEIRRLAQ